MRIAIVQVGWPIQSYSRDLVNGLVGQGHHVDFIAAASDHRGMIDLDSIQGNLTLLDPLGYAGDLLRRLRGRLAARLGLSIAINPPWMFGALRRFFTRQTSYDILIGVEKAGLELASDHGHRAGIPVIYYSLELYVDGHPEQERFAWQRASEFACHGRAIGTIIQDCFRWEILRQANHITSDSVFHLPVGIAAASRLAEARHARAAPSSANCRLLSFGVQGHNRYSPQLIAQAHRLPSGMQLQLHGPAHGRDRQLLAQTTLPANVSLHTELLPEADLPALFAAADIGLALYRSDVANDRLTAYSSQKVALYLQAGLPVIAFRSEAFADLFSRFPCGEMIDTLDDLGAAAQHITDQYGSYAQAASSAFDAIYKLDSYWPQLASFLGRHTIKGSA